MAIEGAAFPFQAKRFPKAPLEPIPHLNLETEALGLAAKGERFLSLPCFKLKRFVLGRLERAKRLVANRLELSYRAKRGKRFSSERR